MAQEQMIPDPVVPPPEVPSRPRTIDISLTGRCNLRCQYCFYNNEMIALEDLSTEDWFSFFQEIGSLAVRHVTLSGGEVFTRPDFFDLIDGVIENRMRYSILTNGTLITEETLLAFEKGKRRLRLDSIQVSIDGSCADIHNKSRPPNSFDRAIQSVKLLKQANFPVTVRVTINRHNINDLDNIAELLLSQIGLSSFSTNEAEQMGTARCNGQDVALTDEERIYARSALSNLNKRHDNCISADAGPLAFERHLEEIEKSMAEGKTALPGRGTLSSCGGVYNKMAVLHDGTMVPCNMLPALTMGKIGTTPLKEAWLHHPSINVVRQRMLIPLQSLATCSDCNYTGFCSGGCPANAMAKFNRLNEIDPTFCYRLQKRKGAHQ